MAITRLGTTVLEKLKPYLEETKPRLTTERCCVYLSTTAIHLIHVDKTETAIKVQQAQTFDFADPENLPLVLSSFVKKHELENVPTTWLLAPGDYQIFLIDGLPVPQDEIRNALNWRIRKLISYPVTEAALDYFLVPAKISSPEHPLIGAVSAKKNLLSATINLISKSGLALSIIDIPELALKNLSALYENNEKCTAFLYFTTNIMIINISMEKTLYFTRQVTLPKTSSEKELCEKISLEILRYFDYFQSQWRHNTPTRIFVASDHKNNVTIAQSLTENLHTQVDVFSLKTLVEDEKLKKQLEDNFLLPFGCALREGNQYVPAKN